MSVQDLEQGGLSLKPLALLAGADDRFAMPLAVTLFSALDNLKAGRRVNVYIMNGGISASNRARIERVLKRPPVNLQLEWVNPDPDVVRALPVPLLPHYPVIVNFRILAPYLVPDSRVIYLDSDVIVRKDLDELWSLKLAGRAVAAVLDLGSPTLSGNIKNWQGQQFDPSLPYFNSGVLLMDLGKWRTDRLAEAVLENLQRNKDVYMCPDQDALNAVLQRNWLELDAGWNTQVNDATFQPSMVPLDNAAAVHYSMNFKPWQWTTFAKRKPYYNEFFIALERSRWFSASEYLVFRTRHALSFISSVPGRTAQYTASRWHTKPRGVVSRD